MKLFLATCLGMFFATLLIALAQGPKEARDFLGFAMTLLFVITGLVGMSWGLCELLKTRQKPAGATFAQKKSTADEPTRPINVCHPGQLARQCPHCAHDQDTHEICQTLGKALGYPYYKDDPVNFPNATEAHGVCVGDNDAVTLAHEAASRIRLLETMRAASRIRFETMRLREEK